METLKHVLLTLLKGIYSMALGIVGLSALILVVMGPLIFAEMGGDMRWLWLYLPHFLCITYSLGGDEYP